MAESGYFVVDLLICAAITLGIIAVTHRRFHVMMVDLCEGEARANFWTVAVEAWFFLYSITSAMRWCPSGMTERDLFLASIKQIRDGLEGTSDAIIMFSAGLLVFVFIRKFRGREREALERGNQ